jgi:tRNA A-37 threonylcarbamoyl transferase component Bud32
MLRKSIEHFAKHLGIDSIRECRPSRDSHKRAFWLGDKLIAKTFTADTRERYERERAFLQIGDNQGRTPKLVASFFDPDAGGYLVMTALKGRVAADIHRTFSVREYTDFVCDLGKSMAAIHATPASGSVHLIPSNLEAERRSQFDAFPSVADRLSKAGILDGKAIPALAELVRIGKEQAFAGSPGLIHGDLHVWNILVDKRNRRPWCSLIDFEESGRSLVELDFVSPFISVLGLAFPGRRLARWWKPIWAGFVDGYASLSNEAPKLDVVLGHAVAWCLWGSARCLDHGQPRYRELARSALGAAAVSGDRYLTRLASGPGK